MKAQKNPRLPSFNDYRATNDGVMVADLGFKKQLWALDPELDVVWDWAARKWEIWRFPGQERKPKKVMDERARHIMTVQTQKRTFRELGTDILLRLQAGDTTKYSLKQLVDYFDALDDNIQRAKAKEFKNKLESIRIETDRYVRGVPNAQVSRKFNLKPSERALLLNVTPVEAKPNYHIFKPSTNFKVARAVGGS